jgi:hypothetical protein
MTVKQANDLRNDVNSQQVLPDDIKNQVGSLLGNAELSEDEADSILLAQAISEHDGSFLSFDSVIAGYNKLHGTNFDEENLVNG